MSPLSLLSPLDGTKSWTFGLKRGESDAHQRLNQSLRSPPLPWYLANNNPPEAAAAITSEKSCSFMANLREIHCGHCACLSARHRWHQNISIHTRVGARACFGAGGCWSIMTCSVLLETHCKLSHPINPAAGKTKHKTYDRLMTAVLQRPE